MPLCVTFNCSFLFLSVFLDLYILEIRECEPIGSVVADILSDGQLESLKQFYFQSKSLQVYLVIIISLIMESLFASHPNLVHIGIGSTVISSSDMAGLCKYMSSRSQSGSPEFTLALIHNSIDSESLRLFIEYCCFFKDSYSFGYLSHPSFNI